MDGKNRQTPKFGFIVTILIFLGITYLMYYFLLGGSKPLSTFNSGLGQFKVVSQPTLQAVKKLESCGQWPIASVGLSPERGNPFSRKSSSTITVLPLTSPDCSPVF